MTLRSVADFLALPVDFIGSAFVHAMGRFEARRGGTTH